ncbi:MAG: SPFH domain-containing protein [Candidatus Moraniibacteriota bacterium]
MKKNVILWLLAIIVGIPSWLMSFSFGSSLMNEANDIAAFIGYAIVTLSIVLPTLGIIYSISKFVKKNIKSVTNSRVSTIALMFLMGATMLFNSGCSTKVKPGYVGIKVDNVGSNRGVQDIPIVTGLVWYNPFTEDIYQYPTFTTTETWTHSKDEGKAVDESMTFNSIEGAVINADVSVSFAFVGNKVPALFVKFREDPKQLADTYIRSRVRDHLNAVAGSMRVVDIFGAQKHALLLAAKAELKKELDPLGIDIQTISFINALRVDIIVRNSINNVITSTQQAIAAENKVREIKALAQQEIERARGEKTALEINPDALAWKVVERWNGVLPLATGGGSSIINLPSSKR